MLICFPGLLHLRPTTQVEAVAGDPAEKDPFTGGPAKPRAASTPLTLKSGSALLPVRVWQLGGPEIPRLTDPRDADDEEWDLPPGVPRTTRASEAPTPRRAEDRFRTAHGERDDREDGRRGPRGEGKGRGKRRPGKDARHAAGPPRHRDDRGGGARDEGRDDRADPDRILQHAFARSGWWRDFNCGELALASWLIPFVVNSIVTHPFSCPDRMRGVCFVHVLFYHQTYLPYGRMAEISRPVLLGFHVWAPYPGICPHHRKLVVVLRISGGRRHPVGRRGVLGPGLRSYSFCNPFPFNLQTTYFLTPVTPFNPVINLSSPELCCRVL